MKKNPKICLLGASFGTNNMGVSALTSGALTAFYHQFPDGELFLVDYGKKGVTHNFQMGSRIIPVQLVNIRFSKKFYLKNNIALLILFAILARLIPFTRIRKKVISGNLWLSRIIEADVVASLAGGDSFSDIYGLGRFFYVSLPQILALSLEKKLIFLPQTIGPFKYRISKIIARYIMNRTSVIYSRDYIGLDETRKLLGLEKGSEKLRFCYDVGFVVDPLRPNDINLSSLLKQKMDTSALVGLNVSGLLFMGGYTKNNMFGMMVNYKELAYDLVDFLIQKKNATVLLVPHVFGSQEHMESDSVVCEKIHNELKAKYKDRICLVHGSYNQNEIKYIIGLCDFFVGSRMHACIAALSQNIPAVAIAYSKKFYGVMQTIGVESLVADPRKLGKEEIISIISNAYERRDSLRRQLERKMSKVRETVLGLFKTIATPS